MENAARQTEHMIALLRRLNRSRDPDALAQAVLEHAVSVVPGAQRGSFMLLSHETDCYEICAAVGWPLEQLREIALPASEVLEQSDELCQPTIVREPCDRKRGNLMSPTALIVEALGPLRSILTFPIAARGRVVAYLNLDNVEDPDAFTNEDVQRLEVVGEEIAVAAQAVLEREQLGKLEGLFSRLFEQLADAVYIVEFDGTILEVNRAACTQSGYSREELVGMNMMHDLAHEEPVVTYQNAITLLSSGELARFEEVKRRKDGALYITDCAVTVFTYHGRPVTLSINRDITQRKKTEQEIAQRNRELETLSKKLQDLHLAAAEMDRCQDAQELCQTAVNAASGVLGMSVCNVGLAKGAWMIPVASSAGAESIGRPMRRGEGLVGKVWETGQTLWGDVRDFPNAKPVRTGPLSVITVPVGQEGVFQAVSDSEDAFSRADVSLAEILVMHLSNGLERLRLEGELREQATRDALTGLYNRRYMREVLEREMARAKQDGHPVSVIMADIDQFKLVNDRFGHSKGDQVLREIAGLLQAGVGNDGYIFRYGGEEFVILLPKTATRAGEVIEGLQEAIRRWTPSARLGDLGFALTMGATIWDPRGEPEVTPEALLHRADEVLYDFKRRKGR